MTEIPSPATSNFRRIVLSVATAVFLVRLDGYMINIALPAVGRHFQADTAEVSWVILSYFVVMSSTMLIAGKLGDRMGLRRIFLLGYALSALTSLLCGLAPSLLFLDLARSAQGIGDAMTVTAAFAMVAHFIPPERRGEAFGLCALANSLGIMLGAPLGGVVTGLLSWPWIFFFKVPACLIAMVIAGRFIPEVREISSPRRAFDIIGGVLSFLFVFNLIYGLHTGRERGWSSPEVSGIISIAVFSFIAFLYREGKAVDPIVDKSIFRVKALTPAFIVTFLATMLLAGGNFLLPFYLELTKGLPPEQAGFIIMIYAVVYMPVGLFSGRLADRIPPRFICRVAMAAATLSSLFFAATLHLPGLAPVMGFLILLAVSYGLFFAANNSLVMSLPPPDRQGITAGLYSTVINLGMVSGVCLMEGVYSSCLLEGATAPSDLVRAFSAAFLTGAVSSLLATLASFYGRR